MDSPLKTFPPAVALSYLTILSAHHLCHLSLKNSDFLLSVLAIQAQILSSTDTAPPPSLPRTARTIISQLQLTPKFISYACCPECFSLYKCDSSYPQHCTHQPTPDRPQCGAELCEQDAKRPVREYVMQDFKDWLARFYARPEIESLLDHERVDHRPSKMQDIWDGEAFRTFQGPDGKHFLVRPQTESRVIFSINMDGFNPFTNKQNGKQVSCGAIYMVCLNLPPHLRYQPENTFLVGVIPGPREPSMTQMNSILRPLVDVLAELWDVGIFFERTPAHPFGRKCRVAVMPLVADIPAGKKMAGFGSCLCKHFCSFCHTILDDKDSIESEEWIPRTLDTHYKHAVEWRDAKTVGEQEKIFEATGVRWSELLRLSYWDPTSYTAIDSMHCFYLGLFHHHVLNIWGMQDDRPNGPGATYDPLVKKPAHADLCRAREHLEREEFGLLESFSKPILVHLCFEKGLRFAARSKPILVKRLRTVSAVLFD